MTEKVATPPKMIPTTMTHLCQSISRRPKADASAAVSRMYTRLARTNLRARQNLEKSLKVC